MELSREILKQFAQIANGNSNKKQTTPSYMNATAVVSDGVKYVKIDGSDQMTPVSETMGIQNGDRVLVTIENHQATVIGNYSYPADARTANEALSVGGQALTAAGQAAQRIDVLQASSITTEKLEAGLATIGYLTVTELRALIATVDTLDAKAITTDKLEAESIKAGFVKTDQLEATYATIEQLNSTNAKIETLEAGRVTAEEIKAAVAEVGYLKVSEITGENGQFNYLTSTNLDAKYATITSLNAATARIGTLETDTLKTKDLESEVGKFGYLKASNLESEVGKFGYLKASEAVLQYATITSLNAEAANISNLNAEFATFKSTTTQDLIAAKGWMAEGSIGDAQISKVSANKLDAGTIDTSVVTVKGSDGKLQIVDNTLQISDANRVRVQVGKDGTGDYTLAVWDVNGQLIWDALGATENTIQRAIIRDSMVSGDAAIQALKIDFQSFETALTQQGLTISGTVVQVGDKQLNVVLSEQTQYVDDSIAGIDIGGRNLIPNSNFANGTDGWVGYNDASFRVSNDTYYDKALIINHSNIIGSNPSKGMVYKAANDFVHESDTTYTLSFMAKTTGASSGAEPILFSAAVKLSSNDIAKSKTHNIASSQWQKFTYTYTTGTIASDVVLAFWIANGPGPIHITNIKLEKGNKATDWTPAPEDVQDQIDTHTTKLSSHETRITANEEAINLRVTSQEFTEYQNGVAANFSSIDTSLSVLNGAIESKVTQTEIDNAIAGLEIGGRNLLRNSNFKNGSQHWLGVNAPLNVIADSVYGNALSFYTTIKGSVSDRIYYDTSNQGFSHVAGETYTLSFFAKASVNTKLQSSVAGNATSIETYELTTTWQRFTHTYTAPQHGSLSFWPVDANVTIYLTNVKLEKGNKATDWTPAPEDVDASISHATSIATQTAEKFEWMVRSDSSISSLVLTDTMLTAITDQFKVVGPDGSTTIISGGTMNVNNIFAQDILASGSISGVTLHGVYGEIGGWSINSNCLYSSYTVGEETTTVVMQNVIDNAKFSYAYITLDNCTATITGTSVLARPVETAESNINIRIPLKTGSYTLYIYSGYIAKYSDVEYPDIQWQWIDSNGDLNFEMIEVATEVDRVTGSDGSVRLVKWQIDNINVPVGSTDAKLFITHPMPSAKAVETYEFIFQLEQNGIVYDLSPKLSVAGVTVDKFLAVQKEVAGNVHIPFYVTSNGYLYTENAHITGNSTFSGQLLISDNTGRTTEINADGNIIMTDSVVDYSRSPLYVQLKHQHYRTTLNAYGLSTMFDMNDNFTTPEQSVAVNSSGIQMTYADKTWQMLMNPDGSVNVTGNLTIYNGSTQTPLFITGYAANESSIRYSYNGLSYNWVVGPGAGYNDFSKFGFYKSDKGALVYIDTNGSIGLKGEIINNNWAFGDATGTGVANTFGFYNYNIGLVATLTHTGVFTVTSQFNAGGKIAIFADSEGGNLQLVSPNGTVWELDAIGNSYARFFNYSTYKNFNFYSDGGFLAQGQITAGQDTANAFRAVNGDYGFIIRNDGTNTYLMTTHSGDPYGSWNKYITIANTDCTTTFPSAVTTNGALTVYSNIACTGAIYANTFSNNSGNLTKITGTSFILLQANGFAIRVGEGVNGASYKVLMPVTTANAASNDVVYLGVPSARWKFIYSASSVNVSSDERDKDITELDERYLNAFHKLNVITYRWKNDPEKLHIGFSAQAVKRAMNTHGIDTTDMGAICHDFWTDEETGEEKERYSLCYEEITLLTVPVVQKHSVTLTEHAAKLVNIESQLESLKTELDEAHIEIARLKKLVNVS